MASPSEDVNEEIGHGTIRPATNFDAEADAAVLRKAMKGMGTDEAAIIDLLSTRNNAQRQEIRREFKQVYGRDLMSDLKSELSGKLEDCVLALMEPKALYDAKCLRHAMKGLGTDEQCLIEILCSRTNREIAEIKSVYKSEIGRNLEKDVVSETSGDFKKLLVTMIQGAREETPVDMDMARSEAQELYDAGEKQWGTDESKFNQVIAHRSFPQLRATFDEYSKLANRDILDSIDREMSGDLRDGFKAIVMCVRGRPGFFAEKLWKSMKGMGTDDSTLIRIVVSRSEVDLFEIKGAFQESHQKTLNKAIEGDTSGDYRKLLLAIVGDEHMTVSDLPPSTQPAAHAQPSSEEPATAHEQPKEMGGVDVNEEIGHGTVQPATNFDADADSAVLRKAMKGMGTDEDAIIDLLTKRSNAQRQEIRVKYQQMHGRDLIKDLKSELSGNLEESILALMEPSVLYDARSLRRAMKGMGTDEECLIEILCSRTNKEIAEIKKVYKSEIGRNLEKDVVSETSGHFKRLLVSMVQGGRETSPVDMDMARREAQELYDAGEKKWGTDESKFNQVIAQRSFPQLRATFDEYAKIANRDILDSIEREMSGDLKHGFRAVVMCARGRPSFFAERLWKSMKGMGTDDSTLIRIVVSRSEVDLVEIKQSFLLTHQKQLSTVIHGDTSGDYRKVLLAVVGDEPIAASQQQSSSSKWFGGKDQGSSDELVYLRQALAVKEQELAARNKTLAEKNDELAAIRQKLSEKEGEVSAKDQALTTKTTELATTVTTLSVKEEELVTKDQALTTKTDELSATQQQLTTAEGELAAQKEVAAAKTRELDAKQQELAEVQRELAGKDATIHMHETTIVTLRSQTTTLMVLLAEVDAEILMRAMKGWFFGLGTDEVTIINVLTKRSNAHRQEIRKKFQALYSKDLIQALRSETSGNFRECIVALMEPKALYDAKSLRNAIGAAGAGEQCIIEILCTRTNKDIAEIKEAYKSEFSRELENDVAGSFKKLFVSMIQGAREETPADVEKARQEAQELHDAGAKQWGTDGSKFSEVIAQRSFPQLRAIFDEYAKIAKGDIVDAINSEMPGDLKEGFKAVVLSIRNPPAFFAEKIWNSMQAPRDHATLIRIMVTRFEVDLAEIKKTYMENRRVELARAVEGVSKGDYRRILVALASRDESSPFI